MYSVMIEDVILPGTAGTSIPNTNKVMDMANIPSASVSSLLVGIKGMGGVFSVDIYLNLILNHALCTGN
ncbi:MAG: hypothetical protein A4E27_00184 [Methanobacterium sp. PtaU1.Bin242]|nr:MAG: hypothetical protein A4E27_00184 [Methanobacterium sp. PtaU1.Bin242]